MVEGRAGRCSAAAAGQGAGGGDAGGAEQTPAVHVLHTQIRPGGAAAGEDTSNGTQTQMRRCLYPQRVCNQHFTRPLCVQVTRGEKQPDDIQRSDAEILT